MSHPTFAKIFNLPIAQVLITKEAAAINYFFVEQKTQFNDILFETCTTFTEEKKALEFFESYNETDAQSFCNLIQNLVPL
ncbi:hypothetical protein ACFOWM_06185 [Ferruginibacter yonginensis]|uniref:Uncharacterized protein n=1 Tax=Ferruginibacter yonginensis TaxID=1310416 RepID=A0ABV8QQ95_9BACT